MRAKLAIEAIITTFLPRLSAELPARGASEKPARELHMHINPIRLSAISKTLVV